MAFTARWVGGGDGCSHYNLSLAIRTSLDGNTFDEVPAVVLELQGVLATTAPAHHCYTADAAADAVLRHCDTHMGFVNVCRGLPAATTVGAPAAVHAGQEHDKLQPPLELPNLPRAEIGRPRHRQRLPQLCFRLHLRASIDGLHWALHQG